MAENPNEITSTELIWPGKQAESENALVIEFQEFLEDPLQQSWIQAYLDGDQEAEILVEAVLKTLEESYEIEMG